MNGIVITGLTAAVAVLAATKLLRGVTVRKGSTLLIVAALFGVLNAMVAQPCGVERCVQAVGSNRRSRVHAPDTIDQRRGEPCRRMHREIKRNQTGGGDPLVC